MLDLFLVSKKLKLIKKRTLIPLIVPVYSNKYVIKDDTKNKKKAKVNNFESFLKSKKVIREFSG